jgi:hypothetical protein
MRKFLNKGISAPSAIILILVFATAVGVFTFWQYSEIKKEQEKILTENQQQNADLEKNQETAKPGYVPKSLLGSDDKILDYLGGLYCGLLRDGVSSDGAYKKKLVANKPDFFISVCSVGGECARGTTMNIYSVDRETGLISTVWWSNVYVWAGKKFSTRASADDAFAASDARIFMKSKVNFEDLDGDGNYEIIQDIDEMQCSNNCGKEKGCCQPEDYCVGENIVSQDQYQKKFKWQDNRERFLEFY